MQRMRYSCDGVAVVAFVMASAAAQPVQKESKDAIPNGGAGTGAQSEQDCDFAGTWQGDCLDARIKRLDMTLNAAFERALVGQASRGLSEELHKSQRAWLQYLKANCGFVGVWGGVSGAGSAFYKQSCIAREYVARIHHA